MFTRDDALVLLGKYVTRENLFNHCLSTAAVMKKTAEYLNRDPLRWEIIGILHDIDYEFIDGDMARHGTEGYRILRDEGVDEDIAVVVKRHNDFIYGITDTPEDRALQAADNISGLIIAAALMKGGRVTDVTPKTISKKFKEKSFAAGCRREQVALIEPLIDLPMYFGIAIGALVDIRDVLGLS
jgi:putative nucleotidyltransferase with HDIG domain